MPKNMEKAREQRAQEIKKTGVAMGTAKPPSENSGSGEAGIPFSLDQLFAAYGAKEFENQMLRQRLQVVEQQVVTLQNVIRVFEAAKPEAA